ncbi:PREDICTED: synaptonemal complex central element protein 3 [Sturnus vulgaris]|uniref:synaptonemal complex central element protein 3 n=1 Tax=Sturnus vulgaris TaxID=9172 RepID=UPI000719FDC4|nr:PREDICTED: synaptonemal complex central element protein 3 [Sturnus vulgaris]
MAESESQEGNYDNRRKNEENLRKDMKRFLEQMERLTVRAACTVYNCATIKANPDLLSTRKHLEEAFLMCREQIEKKWQEVLMESRGEGQKKE